MRCIVYDSAIMCLYVLFYGKVQIPFRLCKLNSHPAVLQSGYKILVHLVISEDHIYVTYLTDKGKPQLIEFRVVRNQNDLTTRVNHQPLNWHFIRVAVENPLLQIDSVSPEKNLVY